MSTLNETKECRWRKSDGTLLHKISNQAQTLNLLSLGGGEELNTFKERILDSGMDKFNIDPVEAGAAKLYFHYLCPQLNRREEAPFNSCLNYGYSIIRNTIIRALIAAGLLPAFGIHHKNLFNAFNLADDLIEPFRPSVDLISYYITGDTIQLDRSQRRKLAEVLLQAVRMNGRKVNIFTAINMMVDDLRSFYCGEKDEIALPDVLPEEKIDMVRE